MINIIAANLPTFMIGRLFNATNLGLFNRGQSLAYFIPLNFSNVLTQACYPVFVKCKMMDNACAFFREICKNFICNYFTCYDYTGSSCISTGVICVDR